MSSSSPAPSPAQIEDRRKTPIVVLSAGLDTATTAASKSPAGTLLTQPNPRIPFDGHNAPLAGSVGQRSIFKLIEHAAAGGLTVVFPIPPVVPEGAEILGFSRLRNLNIDAGQESAPHGGRS